MFTISANVILLKVIVLSSMQPYKHPSIALVGVKPRTLPQTQNLIKSDSLCE